MVTAVLTTNSNLMVFNDIFNNIVILTAAMVVASTMWKIGTHGATADTTISKIKFAMTYLLVVGCIYGGLAVNSSSFHGNVYKWTAGLANTEILNIDPNYIKNG